MALTDIVNVVITTTNPGVTQAGFGVPLILSNTGNAWATSERTRTYNGIAAVVADFPATTPEWAAANTIFSQNPAPPTVMIGKGTNKPTQVHVVTILSVVDSTSYSVNVWDKGVLQKATFTSGVGTTNDLIVAGLVSAINALAAPSLDVTATATGTVGSKVVTVTANAAGTWFAVEPLELSVGTVGVLMAVAETESDPGVTADLTAIANESSAWYGLILLHKSSAIVLAAATFVESNTKLFIVSTADTKAATDADSGATDVLHALKAAARARTGPAYHPRNYEFFDAAEIGRFLPINPGGENWRMKTLSGPTPANLTATQIVNVEAKRGNFYYVIGSVNAIGGGGLVSDNEYIDVIRFRDWWVARVSERLVNLELSLNKIPYTDDGVALIEAEVRAQNQEGILAGGIAPSPKPTVTAPLVASVPSSDKQSRTLNNVNTTWTLAGAINKINVNAQINV